MVLAALLWGLFFISGCAGSLPNLQPLNTTEHHEAERLRAHLLQNRTPQQLDADIVLGWHGYGQTRQVSGGLQASAKGAFRLTVPDPLGRPLLLLVADAQGFTLIDNQQGHAYTGPVWNHYVTQYIPTRLPMDLLFSLLVDRFPEQNPRSMHRDDSRQHAYWYVFDLADGLRHMVMAEANSPLPRRQLLLAQDKTILLDLAYTGQNRLTATTLLPRQLIITGDKLPGEFQIDFQTLYPEPQFSGDIFHIRVPPHFDLEEVH